MCGTSYYGNDGAGGNEEYISTVINVPNAAACAEACESVGTCNAADFNEGAQECLLLSGIDNGSTQSPGGDAVVRMTFRTPTSTTTTATSTTATGLNTATCAPAAYSELLNYNYAGSSQNIVGSYTGVSGISGCEGYCNCVDSCSIAVFKKDSGVCYLLSYDMGNDGYDANSDSATRN